MFSRRMLLIVALTLALAVVVTNIPLRSTQIWIDDVTGSMKEQTCWLFFDQSPKIQESAIERWIVMHEGAYTPTWRRLSLIKFNLFGHGISRACALAPPIYPLPYRDLSANFVRTAPDTDIAEFVRVMRTGTESQKRRCVESVCEFLVIR